MDPRFLKFAKGRGKGVLNRASIACPTAAAPTPQSQIDTITLTGTNGSANITSAGGLTEQIIFITDLPTTAISFVTAHSADYLAQGIVLTSSGANLIFTGQTSTPFTHPVITNMSGDLTGTVANTQAAPAAATLDDVVSALHSMEQNLVAMNASLISLVGDADKKLWYRQAFTITVAQPNELPQNSTDYQYGNIGLFLKGTAPEITVYNDGQGPGAGVLYIRSTLSPNGNWSAEFPIYPGDEMPFYNVWDLCFRSSVQGLPFRVTEEGLVSAQLNRAQQPTLVAQNKWGVNVVSPTTSILRGVWLQAINVGYAVGDAGTILDFNGDVWTLDPQSGIVTVNRLNKVDTDTLGVIGPNVKGGWAVGITGTIIYLDVSDNTWKLDPQSGIVTVNNLNGILIYDSNALVIAVGEAGTILLWDGTTWSAAVSGTTNNLRGIAFDEFGDLWVCGDNGYLAYSPDGGVTWISVPSGINGANITDNLYYIWFTESRDLGYAVGTNGRILQITPSTNTIVNIPTGLPAGIGSTLFSIDMVSETTGFVVGNSGNIFYWDGTNFYAIPSPTSYALADVAGAAINVEYAVGIDGTIINLLSFVYPTVIEDQGVIMTPLKEQYEEKQIVTSLAIRDTNPHDPVSDPLYNFIYNSHRYKIDTFFIENTLDQSVSVQIMGNRINSVVGAVTVGSPFTAATPQIQIDTITLTGTNGTANVTGAGGLTKLATFVTDLPTTATNFVTAYAAAYLAQGIVLTTTGIGDLVFTASVAGTSFVHPVITNATGNLAGTVVNTQANVTGTVAATFLPENTGWLPFYFPVLKPTVAPSTGVINVYVEGRN